MSAAPRILVLRRGGLGDTLLLLPLLRALRRRHPDHELDVAGVTEFVAVLAEYGVADRARSSEDLALWRPALARERLAGYRLVVGDEPLFAHVALDPARVLPGTSFGLQLARQAGLEPRWPDDAWLVPARPDRGGATVLAPGSGGRHKCWPPARWLELADCLRDDELLVVAGPTEHERDDPRRWPWPRAVDYLAGLTTVELARRFATAGRCFGNDSGVTHLAACMGVPTVAIFGPTDPAVWAPVGPHVRVVGGLGRDLATIAVDEVLPGGDQSRAARTLPQ